MAMQEIPDFLGSLKRSGCTSVDAFLGGRRGFVPIGKEAMAYYLVERENINSLFRAGIDQHWYEYLWNEMLATDGFDGFADNELNVITYNYDRSLEMYLFKSLMNRFHVTPERAREALATLSIVHLHGHLGQLRELDGDGNTGRPFGTNLRDHAGFLIPVKDSLRIVYQHENFAEIEEFQEAHRLLAQAQVVIFLGFGYLAENIRRLRLDECCLPATEFWGTAVDLEDAELAEFARELPVNGPHSRMNFDTGCSSVLDFLRRHRDLFRRDRGPILNL